MDFIQQPIQVSWQHRVFFTTGVFEPANSLLQQVLEADAVAEMPRRVLLLLEKLGFELGNDDLQRAELLAGVEEFREHLGGRLAITLLRDIGVGFEVNEMKVELIREAIRELTQRWKP